MKKETWIVLVIWIVAVIASYFLGYHNGTKCNNISGNDTVEIIDTFIDTFTIKEPKYIERKIVRIDTVYMLTVDTVVDSVKVEIPIEQKVYTDSSYTAWVSGFRQNLDSISIYQKNIETVRTVTQTKKDRFNVSIGCGAGFGLIHKKTDIYLGVSLNYRLWGF